MACGKNGSTQKTTRNSGTPKWPNGAPNMGGLLGKIDGPGEWNKTHLNQRHPFLTRLTDQKDTHGSANCPMRKAEETGLPLRSPAKSVTLGRNGNYRLVTKRLKGEGAGWQKATKERGAQSEKPFSVQQARQSSAPFPPHRGGQSHPELSRLRASAVENRLGFLVAATTPPSNS